MTRPNKKTQAAAAEAEAETSQDDRVQRLEIIVAALASGQPPLQTAAQELTGELVADVVEHLDEVDNTPNADGHSPKMLRDWDKMTTDLMRDENLSREDADAQLDKFFGAIESGELVDDGTGNYVPA